MEFEYSGTIHDLDALLELKIEYLGLNTSSGGLFEGAFDEGEAAFGLFAQEFFLFAAFA